MKQFALGFASATALFAIAGAAYWFGARHAQPTKTPDKDPPHHALVRKHLVDPDSARFGESFPAPRDPQVWCGLVNARNRMGGMTGNTRYIALLHESAVDFEDATPDQVRSGKPSFNGRWKVFCE